MRVTTPDEFRAAIASYLFLTVESIYAVPAPLTEEAWGRATERSRPPDRPWVYLLREAWGQTGAYSDIAQFWASALYTYLEDTFCDERFEEVGAAGEYVPLSPAAAIAHIEPLLGTHTGEHAALPTSIEECYRVYDTPALKAVVGRDAFGFFALVLEPGAEDT